VHARDIAMAQGLHYVYTGNVHHKEGDTTFCPSCHTSLIERDWYEINQYRLTAQGHCPDCDAVIAGRFDKQAGTFGRQRIPVAIGAL
jgi:pyruvate formate lyase activating enzyme